MAFSSAVSLVADDTNGVFDVYVRDRQGGTVTRASLRSDGGQTSGGSNSGARISDDGRYIAFSTESTSVVNMTDEPYTDSYPDVCVKDRQTGAVKLANRDNDGQVGTSSCSVSEISADGRCVALNWGPYTQAYVGEGLGASGVTGIEPAIGPGSGGSDAITGAKLIDVSGVLVWRNCGDQLHGELPHSDNGDSARPLAGSAQVVVTSSSYGASVDLAYDDYLYIPTPTISSLSPPSCSVAGGKTVVITGTSLGATSGANGVTFGREHPQSATRSIPTRR